MTIEVIIEDISEGSAVERFIWGKVKLEFSDFLGIVRFSVEDLYVLRSLIDVELYSKLDMEKYHGRL